MNSIETIKVLTIQDYSLRYTFMPIIITQKEAKAMLKMEMISEQEHDALQMDMVVHMQGQWHLMSKMS